MKKQRKKASKILRELSLTFQAQFFTADETDEMREHAIKQLDQAIEELWRERRKLETVRRTRVYLTIGSLARIRDSILTNHELRYIHRRLEEAEEEAKKIEEEAKQKEEAQKLLA